MENEVKKDSILNKFLVILALLFLVAIVAVLVFGFALDHGDSKDSTNTSNSTPATSNNNNNQTNTSTTKHYLEIPDFGFKILSPENDNLELASIKTLKSGDTIASISTSKVNALAGSKCDSVQIIKKAKNESLIGKKISFKDTDYTVQTAQALCSPKVADIESSEIEKIVNQLSTNSNLIEIPVKITAAKEVDTTTTTQTTLTASTSTLEFPSFKLRMAAVKGKYTTYVISKGEILISIATVDSQNVEEGCEMVSVTKDNNGDLTISGTTYKISAKNLPSTCANLKAGSAEDLASFVRANLKAM